MKKRLTFDSFEIDLMSFMIRTDFLFIYILYRGPKIALSIKFFIILEFFNLIIQIFVINILALVVNSSILFFL